MLCVYCAMMLFAVSQTLCFLCAVDVACFPDLVGGFLVIC